MIKHRLYVVVLSLVMVSIAHAHSTLTLTSLTPENTVGGYLPGTVVDFQVDLSQVGGSNIELRFAQLDFSVSDSDLAFMGDFTFIIV